MNISEQRTFWRFGVIALAVILMLTVVSAAPGPQGNAERYFDETGHTVRGQFLTFFDKYGGVPIFGYPITDEFLDPKTQRLVQYFQYSRFESHPENPEPYQVQLGLLGDELKYSQPRLASGVLPQVTSPNCQYFAQTGHNVCDSFLSFFRVNGGIDVFGYPITEYKVENDRIVQVFQRMRLEWHPEFATGQKVQVAALGVQAFYFYKLDLNLLRPKPTPGQLKPVTRLNTRASVSLPVANNAGDPVIVYVVVNDQLGGALEGALVSGIVHFASGEAGFVFPPTNERGITQVVVPNGQTKPGTQVSIDLTITYRNLLTQTRTSFLPWW